MLPLGDVWTGVCCAVPEHPWQPDDTRIYQLCNLGYVRETCERFPTGEGPDAIRFNISGDNESALQISYVIERDHHPFAHGSLEYSRAQGGFAASSPAESSLARQAAAYASSYLRRKGD